MGPWISSLLVAWCGCGPGSCVERRGSGAGCFGGPLYALLQVCTTQIHYTTSHKQIHCRRVKLSFYRCRNYSTLFWLKNVSLFTLICILQCIASWDGFDLTVSTHTSRRKICKQPFRQIRYLQISNDVTWILISLLCGSGNPGGTNRHLIGQHSIFYYIIYIIEIYFHSIPLSQHLHRHCTPFTPSVMITHSYSYSLFM